MNAEYKHKGIFKLFNVAIDLREDGTTGPAYRLTVSDRSCPYSDPVTYKLELDHYDAERDVAVYRMA